MKRCGIVLLTVLSVLWAQPAFAQFVHVATRTACSTGCDTTDSFTTDGIVAVTVPATTIGNLVTVTSIWATVSRTISSITCGGTFSQLHRQEATGEGGVIDIRAAIATSSVTTCTVTLTGADNGIATPPRGVVQEWSGPFDPLTESGTSTGSTNAVTTTHEATAVTPDTSEVLFIGAIHLGGSPGVWTFDSDFTPAFTLGTTLTPVLYRIQSDVTSQAFTNSTTNSRTSVVALVGIRGAGAGGAGGVPKTTKINLSGVGQ